METLKIFVQLLVILLATSLVNGKYLNYRDTCDPLNLTTICDPTKFLVCNSINSLCNCPLEEEHFYDKIQSKCFVKIAQPCDSSSGESSIISCPPSSKCVEIGISTVCWCQAPFKPSEDLRSCVPNPDAVKLNHGDHCLPWNYLSFCPEEEKNLFCQDNYCNCPHTGFKWNPTASACLAGHGMHCDPLSPNPKVNETCDPSSHLNCMQNSKCDCDPEYIWEEEKGTRNASCYLTLGSSCAKENSADICVTNAVCKETFCVCDEGYEAEENICRIKTGGSGSSRIVYNCMLLILVALPFLFTVK